MHCVVFLIFPSCDVIRWKLPIHFHISPQSSYPLLQAPVVFLLIIWKRKTTRQSRRGNMHQLWADTWTHLYEPKNSNRREPMGWWNYLLHLLQLCLSFSRWLCVLLSLSVSLHVCSSSRNTHTYEQQHTAKCSCSYHPRTHTHTPQGKCSGTWKQLRETSLERPSFFLFVF